MSGEFVSELADYGLLGLLLAIALGTIFFLYKDLSKSRDGRLSDVKNVLGEDIKFRQELKSLIQSILDILRSGKWE